MLVFSVPESERERRHALRSLLAGLGFGSAAPGVWVAPATLYDETVRALTRAGLIAYTEFFRGDYLGAGDVAARMREWWDLEALTGSVRRVLCRPGGRRRGGAPARHPASAFAAYVPMLTAWRRLPYLDPGLPLEHLPARLAGDRGRRAVRGAGPRLREAAHTHAHAIVHG